MKNVPELFSTIVTKFKSLFMDDMNASHDTGDIVPEENPNTAEQNLETNPRPITKKMTPSSAFFAFFNGMGIGLLLGMLLGLSISPVVSGVIATLSSLLAVLLGLNEKFLDPMKSLRIGAFGLFAVAGILGGMYIRANSPFTPSLLDKKNEYVALGYEEVEARSFITGFIQSDTGKARREANVLYSSSVDIGACDVLVYANADQSVVEIVNTFSKAGGTWEELAVTFKTDLPEEIVGISLITVRDCFCGLTSSKEVIMTNLPEIRKLNDSNTLDQIESVLSSDASGDNWKAIVTKINERIPVINRKDVYLSVIKVLSHE